MSGKVVAVWLSLAMVFGFVVVVDVIIDITPTVSAATTHYVNVSGSSGAYAKIQDSIDNASDGDTVYVYRGAYYENVVVNKRITLIGENIENTYIFSYGTWNVVNVTTDGVNVSGFTISEASLNYKVLV